MSSTDDPTEPFELDIPRRLVQAKRVVIPVASGTGGTLRYRFCIPLSQLDDRSTRALIARELRGGYETEERRAVDRLLRDGDTFFDVGAHWGLFSLHAATAARVAVIAVEPDESNIRHLAFNIQCNRLTQSIRVIPAAAGPSDGPGWLRRNTAMGHHWFADQERAGANAVQVETRTIDGLVRRVAPRAGRIWLKVDVEGRERLVLEGARETLRSGRIAGMIWETAPGGLEHAGTAATEALLAEFGFETSALSAANRLSIRKAVA